MSFKTSFQWFADFNTSTTGMQIVQFSAGGEVVRKRLAPMFAHYRKFKLGAIHVKFVPAATLPVDPTGLSYEEGEQSVDPRDMFNPGLVRNTNGEDVFVPDDTVLNSDFADSLYYSTMLDKRWKKFRLQKGIALRAFPKFWGVANLRQNMYPGFVENVPSVTTLGGNILGVDTINYDPTLRSEVLTSGAIRINSRFLSSDMGLFQTGQKIPMGWMPTGASLKDEFGLLNGASGEDVVVAVQYTVTDETLSKVIFTSTDHSQALEVQAAFQAARPNNTITITSANITMDGTNFDAGAVFAPVPEIPDLLTLVLPRSHKTQFYYRVYVQEDVYFADPITSINAIDTGDGFNTFAPLDVFIRNKITPKSPAEPDRWYAAANGNAPTNDGDDN